jgi:prophage maintenance system killer protein
MTEERKKLLHPFSRALLNAYNKLLESGEVYFPAYDHQIEKLDTIVNTVEGSVFGLEKFPTLQDKVAAYFCFIIKDHPMTDGNKRLAVLWLEIMCNVLDLQISEKLPLDVLAVTVANFDLNSNKISMNELTLIIRDILFEKINPWKK